MAKTLEEIDAQIAELQSEREVMTNKPYWHSDGQGPMLSINHGEDILSDLLGWCNRRLWVGNDLVDHGYTVSLETLEEFCRRTRKWREEREDA